MFFRDLQMKKGVQLDVSMAEVRLPVRLGHRDAQATFAEPLSQQLAAASLGMVSEIKAHETAPSDICGITMYLAMTDVSRRSLETVGGMLTQLHAPIGSSIRTSIGGEPVLFGGAEGLELSVDTAVTPDAICRKELAKSCALAMKDFAISRGWARRADRTLFYFYGESFQRMQDTIERLTQSDPSFSTATARRLA
ncbi:MAG: hypothetical protein OXQ92_14855 [Boseongicola sp.]|nr:hypothetical protein [Boseongicola sp.]MDD9979205.1 hypothetical protein [Boseongicola sp.]